MLNLEACVLVEAQQECPRGRGRVLCSDPPALGQPRNALTRRFFLNPENRPPLSETQWL